MEGSESILQFTQVPTYENMVAIYDELQLPFIDSRVVIHEKEQMLLMIINLLRTRPRIFMTHIRDLKEKCEPTQFANLEEEEAMNFHSLDVDMALELLKTQLSTQPLEISDELTQECRDTHAQQSNKSDLSQGGMPSGSQAGARKGIGGPVTTLNFTGIQEIVIDFICREDMVMATLKEFFEIFIASIRED